MNFEAFVATLGCRNDWSVANQRVMDTRIRDQVGLELVQVHIESTIKAQARCYGANDLSNQAIKVLVVWSWNVEVSSANIIDSLVIDEESTVGVLNCAVGRENGIVWFHNRRGYARSWVDGKLQLAFLAVVCR
jgi:hypothetical protein